MNFGLNDTTKTAEEILIAGYHQMTPQQKLRRIRNAFAHDYPDSAEERHARLSIALEAAKRLIVILNEFDKRIIGRPR